MPRMQRPDRPYSIVTPGNHDGVHLGHRALIAESRRQADKAGYDTLGMCFDPHPTSVLAPERAPVLLTTMARRVDIMREAGCTDVAVLPFDADFAKTAPEVFVRRVLIERCNARGVVIGPDFHFGHRRAGNVDTLRELGEVHGFTVTVVPPVEHGDDTVSSTRIRRELGEGHVDAVTAMLTRVHDVAGRVVKGHQRGRTIGVPTANLDVGIAPGPGANDTPCLPKDGVYAVAARRLDETGASRGERLAGIANIGVRPTFQAGRSVEVHLFDFETEHPDALYGQAMRVGFVGRVRDERRFDGVEALTSQIARDCNSARDMLSAVTNEDTLRWI